MEQPATVADHLAATLLAMEPDEAIAMLLGWVNEARAERDRLRSGLDTILDGLVGLDSDDAYVAITMEHLNVVRAMLRKAGT